MAERKRPCAPMRAEESDPRLRDFLKSCARCGGYLDRQECLTVLLRLSQWLQEAPPALSDRIKKRLASDR